MDTPVDATALGFPVRFSSYTQSDQAHTYMTTIQHDATVADYPVNFIIPASLSGAAAGTLTAVLALLLIVQAALLIRALRRW